MRLKDREQSTDPLSPFSLHFELTLIAFDGLNEFQKCSYSLLFAEMIERYRSKTVQFGHISAPLKWPTNKRKEPKLLSFQEFRVLHKHLMIYLNLLFKRRAGKKCVVFKWIIYIEQLLTVFVMWQWRQNVAIHRELYHLRINAIV